MAQPPVVNGFVFTTQKVAPGQTIDPFSTVTISDPVPAATDSATILLVTAQGSLIRTISDDNGTLVGPGLTGGHGTYTLRATDPATLSAELDKLTFIPAPLPSGTSSVTTRIELDVSRTNDTNPATTDTATVTSSTAPITPATVGVYRFFDTKFGTHFFTASATERDTILQTRSDLTSEGVGLNAIDPNSNDPNAAPVYRFFDTVHGTHFFTISASERDSVEATRPDLTFEGTGFFEHTTQHAGDAPVYRFFDTRFGTHFYTADAGERASILSARPDLKDEGIGFYAPST
jgi:hypothetical protein